MSAATARDPVLGAGCRKVGARGSSTPSSDEDRRGSASRRRRVRVLRVANRRAAWRPPWPTARTPAVDAALHQLVDDEGGTLLLAACAHRRRRPQWASADAVARVWRRRIAVPRRASSPAVGAAASASSSASDTDANSKPMRQPPSSSCRLTRRRWCSRWRGGVRGRRAGRGRTCRPRGDEAATAGTSTAPPRVGGGSTAPAGGREGHQGEAGLDGRARWRLAVS